MTDTPHIDFPHPAEGAANQAAVVANALNQIDALVMPAVINRTTTAKPGSPTEGDRYLIPTGVGTWTAYRNGGASLTQLVAEEIATYIGGNWYGWTPEEGWIVAVAAEDIVLTYDGADWVFSGSYKVTTGITTTGTTQGAAVQLNFGVSQLTVVVGGATAAKLPAAEKGATCVVANADAADAALIFPASGDAINALGVDASFSLAAGKTAIFTAIDATTWYAVLTA